ncbi:MAG: electron transport complex subunit RsxG [Methylomonas sp.]|jgi:electron transport complex protein RnfG|uniref:electron transport complex subunit RsxG n=1 Tax=Methylomonas sp. TaxID=418 RepID=UPI0025F247EF|nr:electron transport complex subunit RsxG [Methylomonas sp.]MCK9606396.1 electron transport complex subunit RsxG [Methylomonas sp.]
MSSDPAHEQPAAQAPELKNASAAKQKLLAFLAPDNLALWRPRLSYQAGVLAVFALLASVLLGFADLATRDVIQQRLDEDLKASLEAVVPADLYDNNLLEDTMTLASAEHNIGAAETMVYLAKKAGNVSAVCFKFIAPDGYAGPISLVMGVNTKGEILGVRVIAHVETPGLGDKIEISKSKWALGFNGKSLDNLTAAQWAVKKDGGVFDQFAGATITPRKVVQAIKRGLDFYQANRPELLGLPNVSEP